MRRKIAGNTSAYLHHTLRDVHGEFEQWIGDVFHFLIAHRPGHQ
jgi:hypothetical protein